MFHRVKSEAAQEKEETLSPEAVTQEAESVEETQEEAVTEEETQAEDTTPDTTTEMTEEEDTNTMSETTEKTTEQTSYTGTTSTTYGGRPVQPSVKTGGYPGAYPGSTYSAAQAPTQASQAPKGDRTLTIGSGITMSGEIESCDNLVVEGTVEAALKGATSLDIAETGTFFGSVEIEEATIAGRFEGELTVTGRLTLRSGGVITGTIVYGEIEIEAGALIDGRMTPIAAGQQMHATAPKTKAPASKPTAKVAKTAGQQAANTDGELFAEQA